jgi:hypothetical protein
LPRAEAIVSRGESYLDRRGIVYNVRMTRRFVDLPIFLEYDVISDPPFMRPKISYKTHGETMVEAGHFFPGVTAEQLPGGVQP